MEKACRTYRDDHATIRHVRVRRDVSFDQGCLAQQIDRLDLDPECSRSGLKDGPLSDPALTLLAQHGDAHDVWRKFFEKLKPLARQIVAMSANARSRHSNGYSMILSASKMNDSGIVRPNAFAVLRLMCSSKRVGCCTGKSLVFSPLRTLST